MNIILSRPPTMEPVSLAEIKTGLASAGPTDDTLLSCLITAARVVCEARTGLVFLPQIWTLALDAWPSERGAVRLPLAPVRRVTSVRLKNEEGRCKHLDAARFRLESNCDAQYLRCLDDWAALAPETSICQSLECDVSAGLADRPLELPGELRRAVSALVAHWYTQKQPVAFGDQTIPIPHEVAEALSPFSDGALAVARQWT